MANAKLLQSAMLLQPVVMNQIALVIPKTSIAATTYVKPNNATQHANTVATVIKPASTTIAAEVFARTTQCVLSFTMIALLILIVQFKDITSDVAMVNALVNKNTACL